MKYEEPIMTILLLETEDIICLSSDPSGDGDNVNGGWSS